MSAPAKCPGCGTKLQPDWEACPNCPMAFLDAPPQKTILQSDTFRNYVPPLVIFGGLSYFIWAFGQYMWRAGETGTRTMTTVTKTTAAPPAAKSAGAAPLLPIWKEAENVEEVEGTGIISIMPDRPSKAKAVVEWKMRGVIYDLITLKPVPGVNMIFADIKTNSRARIQTDARGRYRAILPPLAGRGYFVTLAKSGYAKTYLNPGTEGVSEMPLERRKELVGELSSLILSPASLEPNLGEPLVTDFYLAPGLAP